MRSNTRPRRERSAQAGTVLRDRRFGLQLAFRRTRASRSNTSGHPDEMSGGRAPRPCLPWRCGSLEMRPARLGCRSSPQRPRGQARHRSPRCCGRVCGSPDQPGQVTDHEIINRPILPADHHQPRRVAPMRRVGGNPIRGQLVVKIAGKHDAESLAELSDAASPVSLSAYGAVTHRSTLVVTDQPQCCPECTAATSRPTGPYPDPTKAMTTHDLQHPDTIANFGPGYCMLADRACRALLKSDNR